MLTITNYYITIIPIFAGHVIIINYTLFDNRQLFINR